MPHGSSWAILLCGRSHLPQLFFMAVLPEHIFLLLLEVEMLVWEFKFVSCFWGNSTNINSMSPSGSTQDLPFCLSESFSLGLNVHRNDLGLAWSGHFPALRGSGPGRGAQCFWHSRWLEGKRCSHTGHAGLWFSETCPSHKHHFLIPSPIFCFEFQPFSCECLNPWILSGDKPYDKHRSETQEGLVLASHNETALNPMLSCALTKGGCSHCSHLPSFILLP